MPKFAVDEALASNSRFTGPPPYVKGKTFQESQKLWEIAKIKLSRKIKFDLEASELVNGNEYAVRIWSVVHRQLITANWVAACGPWRIWKSMYRKASLKVQQELKQEPKQLKEILGNALEKSGANEVFV